MCLNSSLQINVLLANFCCTSLAAYYFLLITYYIFFCVLFCFTLLATIIYGYIFHQLLPNCTFLFGLFGIGVLMCVLLTQDCDLSTCQLLFFNDSANFSMTLPFNVRPIRDWRVYVFLLTQDCDLISTCRLLFFNDSKQCEI